jgi:hypothetical protein
MEDKLWSYTYLNLKLYLVSFWVTHQKDQKCRSKLDVWLVYNPRYSRGWDKEDHSSRPVFISTSGWVWCHKPVILATQEAQVGGSWSGLPLTKKWETILKIIRTKRARGMVQVEEHLPSKPKVLSSNPSTVKKKKKMRSSRRQNAWVQTLVLAFAFLTV